MVIALPPGTSGTGAVHEAVPVTSPHVFDAALDHVMLVTPTLSDAVPPSVSGEATVQYVLAVVGDVMTTVGGLVSAGL